MKQTNTKKFAGIIAGLAIIGILGGNLAVMNIDDKVDSQATIPRPPPTPIDDYGSQTTVNEIRSLDKMTWVSSPTFIPQGYELQSIRSNADNLVTMIYSPDQERTTFEDNYKHGITVVYSVDTGVTTEDWDSYITEQVRLDPLRRYISDVDGAKIYVEESEDAYDRPARAYFRDGDNMVVAVSSVVHHSDLEKLIRSTIG